MDYIPYGHQTIEDDDVEVVAQALRYPYLCTGPKAEEFETALAAAVGARYAVVCSNGTAALHLACLAMGIGPGDEVIVPALTFAASANCIRYCGATPVFADVKWDTMLLDMDDVQAKCTNKTRAILPVHYAGECCDMQAYEAFCRERGLQLLQDASHAIGSLSRGKPLGSFGGMQTWSFHAVKTITTGEGGAITTNDETLYKKLSRLRTHGITRDRTQWPHEDTEGPWYYEQLELGYNYRLTDFQCALGINQLKKLPRFAQRRQQIVARYDKALAGLPLDMQLSPTWSMPVRHLYTIRLHDATRRKEVYGKLVDKKIGVNVNYIPVYWLQDFQNAGYHKGLCPITEKIYRRLISIPLHPSLTDAQVEYVIQCLREIL